MYLYIIFSLYAKWQKITFLMPWSALNNCFLFISVQTSNTNKVKHVDESKLSEKKTKKITIVLYTTRLLYKRVHPVSVLYTQTNRLNIEKWTKKQQKQTSISAERYSNADKSIQPSLTETLKQPPTPDPTLTHYSHTWTHTAEPTYPPDSELRRH